MRRKAGSLTELEANLLFAGLELHTQGSDSFFGFQIGKRLEDSDGSYRSTGFSTLYRAMDRLEDYGLLESHMESAELAENARRPRRRLYKVTAQGARALKEAARVPVSATAKFVPRGLIE